MTSIVASAVNCNHNKMPLSRTHPFSVTSLSASALPSHTHTYIQEGNNLPPLKSVLKEQSPPCSTTVGVSTANIPVAQALPEVSHMQSTPSSIAHLMCLSHHSVGRQMKSCSSTLPSTNTPVNNISAQGGEKPKALVATPEQVMKLYMNKLTPYEHLEIFNYPQIYFIGVNAKKRPGMVGHPNNCEYDNEQGSYIHIPHDHVAYRYEVLKVIGKGSFGQVVKAYDHKTHQHVALKMVRNEKRFHRQAQEEIRILEHLRKQDKDNTMNIIHMFDSFTFRNHMCITFELLSINLHELTKKNKFQGFSLQLVRKFSHSLLQCLDALHKNKIIHCDMKPENVLLKQQGRSGLKVRL